MTDPRTISLTEQANELMTGSSPAETPTPLPPDYDLSSERPRPSPDPPGPQGPQGHRCPPRPAGPQVHAGRRRSAGSPAQQRFHRALVVSVTCRGSSVSPPVPRLSWLLTR